MRPKSFEEEIMNAIRPFHDALVEFEKRTKLTMSSNEPLSNYHLKLKGKDLISLSSIYKQMTQTKIVIPEDFGNINGNPEE